MTQDQLPYSDDPAQHEAIARAVVAFAYSAPFDRGEAEASLKRALSRGDPRRTVRPIDWLTIYYNRLAAEAKPGDKLMEWREGDTAQLYLNGTLRYTAKVMTR